MKSSIKEFILSIDTTKLYPSRDFKRFFSMMVQTYIFLFILMIVYLTIGKVPFQEIIDDYVLDTFLNLIILVISLFAEAVVVFLLFMIEIAQMIIEKKGTVEDVSLTNLRYRKL